MAPISYTRSELFFAIPQKVRNFAAVFIDYGLWVIGYGLGSSEFSIFNLTDLPSGTYFLRVTNEEGTAVKRLIVK